MRPFVNVQAVSYEVEPFDKSLSPAIVRELQQVWAGAPEAELANDISTYDLHLVIRLNEELVGWGAVRFASARITADIAVRSGTESVAHTAFVVNTIRALSDGETSIEWWTRGDSAESAKHVAAVNGFPEHRHIMRMERTGEVPASDIKVRSFRADDDNALVRLNNAAFYNHPDRFDFTPAQLHEELDRKHASRSDLLLTHVNQKLAGFIWTVPRPDSTGELYVLAVHPDFQGRGLGGRLLDAGVNHLMAERKARLTYLFVDASQQSSIAMYERHGFLDAGTPLISYLA